MAITVHRAGEALFLGEGVEDEEVAVGIFFVPKRGRGDLAGGVVHGCDEREAGPPLVEPGVVAAIELHEQPLLKHALPPPAVPGWASPAGAPESRLLEDAMDRRMRERESFPLGEEFGQVPMVGARVGGAGEPDDPGAGGVIDAAGRRSPAVPMDQSSRAVPAVRTAQAPDLTGREAEEVSGFGHQKLATVQGLEDDELLLCALRQSDHAFPYSA